MFAHALKDLASGFSLRPVWMALASEDITDQHRRTSLGPLWLLVNYLLFAGTFVLIFRRGEGIPNYGAYVSIGLFVWLYISEVINQSVSLFAKEANFIRGTTLPLTVYVLRLTMQCVIRSGYALIGCLAILFLTSAPVTLFSLWSLLGLVLIVLVTPAAIIVFAMVGAFFPDMKFIISNLTRLGMFVTPIFWTHDGQSGVRAALYAYNPFTWFLEMVRDPIVSGGFPLIPFAICAAITAITWFLAFILLGKYRDEIVFVV